MKCIKCGNDLGIESNSAENVKYCSSCEKHDFPEDNSIERVLRWIVQDRGVEVFQNSSLINALLSDLAPKDEQGRIKIKNALAVGAGDYFYSIVQQGTLNDVSRKQFLSSLSANGLTIEFCNFIFDVFAYSINQSVAVQEEETAKTSANDAYKNIVANTLQNSKKVSPNIKTDTKRDKRDEIIEGKFITSNGMIYEGEFLKEDKTGKGKKTSSNGIIYEGEFLEGFLNGRGKMTYPNGAVYEGEFQKGFKTGKGKITFSSGVIYEGQLVNICPNGKGKMKWPNGCTYEGEFLNKIYHGRGVMTWPGGDKFEGEFWKGKLKKGIYTYADGRVFEGEFYNGCCEGQGKQTWPDGTTYIGEWHKNQRHGKGEMFWPSGIVYEGEFLENQRHGKGAMTWPGGTDYNGEWKDNKCNGKGVMVWPDGTIYDGEWKDDKRDGTGVKILPDRKQYLQTYSQGNLISERKLGITDRIKPCFCGSGMIYKNCHLKKRY